MSKWALYLLGGASIGVGALAIARWFTERAEWEGSVTEPDGTYEEENAVKTSALLSWPVSGRITSPYGTRVHPVTGQAGQFHNGIDIAVPVGTMVRAPADGTVVRVWDDATYGGGYSLVLKHDAGNLATGFAHLSKWLVAEGTKVVRGEAIALSGGAKGQPGAGVSTGAHLHLTVRKNGTTVDPIGELEPVAANIA